MSKYKISLHDVETMEAFATDVSALDYNVYLKPEDDEYGTKINAKSILGVFSLVNCGRIVLIADTDDSRELLEKIQPYIVA